MPTWRKTLCLLLLTAFLSVSAYAEDLLDIIKSRGTLKVGIEGIFPPFNYRGANKQLEGFDIDLANAVAAKLGVTAEFITIEWAGLLGGLQAGKFDVIVNQMSVTPERQQSFDFSQPYTYTTAQLIQHKDDLRSFQSLHDLKGKKLGVSLGSAYSDMAHSVPGIDVKTYSGAGEYILDLAYRRLDAIINNRLLLPYLIKTARLPVRASAIVAGSERFVGIPFRKNNPKFAKALNDALTTMKQDGSLRQISMKWFGEDVSQPPKN